MKPPKLRLGAVSARDWGDFSAQLRRHGYSFDVLRRELGLPGTLDVFSWAWDDRSFPRAARRFRSFRPKTKQQRLAAALLLSRPLPPSQWRGLLTAGTLSVLRRARLLAQTKGRWTFNMALCPYNGFYFLVDSLPRLRQLGWDEDDLPPEIVYFLGPDSLLLAQAVRRRRVERALDLCTGSGIHAILASIHADSVLAVDRNPRAVAVARVNCALNGVRNVRVLRGDLWSAVPRAARFGLIVSNPPILPSAGVRKLWRDGGADGNDVCRRIIAALPSRLASGGRCHMTAASGIAQWLGGVPKLAGLARRWSPYPALVSGNSGLLELCRR